MNIKDWCNLLLWLSLFSIVLYLITHSFFALLGLIVVLIYYFVLWRKRQRERIKKFSRKGRKEGWIKKIEARENFPMKKNKKVLLYFLLVVLAFLFFVPTSYITSSPNFYAHFSVQVLWLFGVLVVLCLLTKSNNTEINDWLFWLVWIPTFSFLFGLGGIIASVVGYFGFWRRRKKRQIETLKKKKVKRKEWHRKEFEEIQKK